MLRGCNQGRFGERMLVQFGPQCVVQGGDPRTCMARRGRVAESRVSWADDEIGAGKSRVCRVCGQDKQVIGRFIPHRQAAGREHISEDHNVAATPWQTEVTRTTSLAGQQIVSKIFELGHG